MNLQTLKSSLQEAFDQADYEVVEKLSLEAINQFPDQALGYYFYGELIQALQPGMAEELIQAYGQAAYLENTNAEYLLKYAHAQFDAGLHDEAAGTYTYLLQIKPKDKDALISLALYEMLASRQNTELAINYLAQIEEPDLEVYRLLAQCYLQLNAFEQALIYIDYALSEENSAQAWDIKGQALLGLERFAEAAFCYETLSQYPDMAEQAFVYEVWMHAAFSANQLDKALIPLQKLQHLLQAQGAELSDNALQMALYIYLGLPDHQAALQTYELVRSRTEDEPTTEDLRILTLIYLGLGQMDKAYTLLDEAMTLAGEDEVVQGEIYLLRNQVLIEDKRFEEAAAVLEQLQANPFFKREAIWAKAQLALAQGQSSVAYEAAYQALKLNWKEAPKWISQHLAAELQNRAQTTYQQYADAAAEKQGNETLQALWGKTWIFESASFKLPAGVEVEAEERAIFDDYFAERCEEMLPASSFLVSPDTIVINSPLLTDTPALQHAFAYRIDKAKGNMLLLKSTSLDGMEQAEFKIKLEADGTVLLAWENTLSFKLKPSTEAVDKLSYRLAQEFSQNLSYLNLPQLLALGDTDMAFKAKVQDLLDF